MMRLTHNRVAASRLLALGTLVAAIAAMLLLAASSARASTTFTVNSTADHADANLAVDACDTGYTVPGAGGTPVPECTLRAAINQANYTTGADAVNFAIPGSGVKTISPESELPTITEAVSINGYTQPGASPNTKAVGSDAVLKIGLSGAKAGDGLVIRASNSTVRGLVINLWDTGIRIDGSGATGNKVTGNYIGTDSSGTQDLGNGTSGVAIDYGQNNTIGGATAGERNVISGNLIGVFIYGSGATGNRVSGNYIGTDATGTKDLGNSSDGVQLTEASGNAIGGATAGERNVISGNDSDGVEFVFGGATGNRVSGNYIGTDATGTKDLGNAQSGVYIYGSPNNTLGGTTTGERNVISGNGYSGVTISLPGATGNRVSGNYVGTDKNGAATLGNDEGVRIANASNNTIGGTVATARNVISGNVYGVVIEGATGASATDNRVLRNVISRNDETGVAVNGNTGNRILSNSIFSNGLLGIDLYDDGPTANDAGDADTGPNNLQNKPVLTSARTSATSTTVRGKLNSNPNKTFVVQFFSNPSGTNEGEKFIGQKSVTTDGSGNATFAFSPTQKVALGRSVTATATSPAGDTSEFSAPRTVVSS